MGESRRKKIRDQLDPRTKTTSRDTLLPRSPAKCKKQDSGHVQSLLRPTHLSLGCLIQTFQPGVASAEKWPVWCTILKCYCTIDCLYYPALFTKPRLFSYIRYHHFLLIIFAQPIRFLF